MARDIDGVGTKSISESTIAVTPLPARTSRTVTRAGWDKACVSWPTKIGPVAPNWPRPSQIACVIAATCKSVKVPFKDVPRWPDVPKDTSCVGSVISGALSKYASTRVCTSIISCSCTGVPANLWVIETSNLILRASPLILQPWYSINYIKLFSKCMYHS